jgi:hypothetical protein
LADSRQRQVGHDDIFRHATKSTKHLTDPGKRLLRGKAIEDVVANVGDKSSSSHVRARLQLAPEPGLKDSREAAKHQLAAGAIGPTMAQCCQDFYTRAPSSPSG